MIFVLAGRVPIGHRVVFCWFTEGKDHPVAPTRHSLPRDFSPKVRADMRIFTHFSRVRDLLSMANSGRVYALPSM
jgi:hypothetical protein